MDAKSIKMPNETSNNIDISEATNVVRLLNSFLSRYYTIDECELMVNIEVSDATDLL